MVFVRVGFGRYGSGKKGRLKYCIFRRPFSYSKDFLVSRLPLKYTNPSACMLSNIAASISLNLLILLPSFLDTGATNK